MHTFKEYLTEIMDGKTKPKLVHETPRSKIYELSVDGHTVTFTIAMHQPGWWVFYFKGEDEEGDETFKLTGKGNEFKVFSAAKWIINDLISDRAPRKIELEAQKDLDSEEPTKRVELYRKLLAKYKRGHYKVVERETEDTVYFTLQLR